MAEEAGEVDDREVGNDEGDVCGGDGALDASDEFGVVEAEGHDEGFEVLLLCEGLQGGLGGDVNVEVEGVKGNTCVERVDEQALGAGSAEGATSGLKGTAAILEISKKAPNKFQLIIVQLQEKRSQKLLFSF